MDNIKNFVDEKTSRLIIQALCNLEFEEVLELSKKSGVPVSRLQDFVDGDEKITMLDKGMLIVHLVYMADNPVVTEKQPEEKESYTSLEEFKLRKTG